MFQKIEYIMCQKYEQLIILGCGSCTEEGDTKGREMAVEEIKVDGRATVVAVKKYI